MGGDKLLPEVIGVAEDTAEGKAISKRRADVFRSHHLPELRPFPKARELIERLERDGKLVTIASSATEEDLAALLDKAGLRHLVEHAASKDDAERSKPDPDIVHAALQGLQLPPDAVAMIGDTPYDVEAARRAKVRPIAFRSGGWKDDDLKGATEIYDGPEDLRQRLDDSSIGRAASRTSGVRMARG